MSIKLFSNKVIFLLIVILGMAYVYLNLANSNQMGGSESKIPPEYIPLTYKFRYLIYVTMVLVIVFAISMFASASKINNMTFSNYIKKGLEQFDETSNKKGLKSKDHEKKIYEVIFSIKIKSTNIVDVYYEIFAYLKKRFNK